MKTNNMVILTVEEVIERIDLGELICAIESVDKSLSDYRPLIDEEALITFVSQGTFIMDIQFEKVRNRFVVLPYNKSIDAKTTLNQVEFLQCLYDCVKQQRLYDLYDDEIEQLLKYEILFYERVLETV